MLPSAGQTARRIVGRIAGPDRADKATVANFGGAVGGLCGKNPDKGGAIKPAANIESALGCPDCRVDSDRPPLERNRNGVLECTECGREFPEKDGLLYLLSKSTSRLLADLLP